MPADKLRLISGLREANIYYSCTFFYKAVHFGEKYEIFEKTVFDQVDFEGSILLPFSDFYFSS